MGRHVERGKDGSMGPARSSPSSGAEHPFHRRQLRAAGWTSTIQVVSTVAVPPAVDDERLLRQLRRDLYGNTGLLRPFTTISVTDVARLFELAERGLLPDDLTAPARPVGSLPTPPGGVVPSGLSRREQSVLEALAGTGSRQAIAGSLFISVNTVKSHLASIYKKLGVTSRTEALATAREQRLLPPSGPE
jgi:DNA-binding NarL/FixJ family response regulator